MTLIEILISVVILASAAVLVMQALARGAYALAAAKNRLTAYLVATTTMAELELHARSAQAMRPEGRFRVGRDQFQWRVETSPTSDDPPLTLVQLTVEWQQGLHTYASTITTIRQPADVPQ